MRLNKWKQQITNQKNIFSARLSHDSAPSLDFLRITAPSHPDEHTVLECTWARPRCARAFPDHQHARTCSEVVWGIVARLQDHV